MLRTVRAVPVFGSDGSPGEGFSLCFSIVEERSTVPVPASVPGKALSFLCFFLNSLFFFPLRGFPCF